MKMILLVLTLLSIPAFGEDRNDPGGWNSAKWGMTVRQVITAFNLKIPNTNSFKSELWMAQPWMDF